MKLRKKPKGVRIGQAFTHYKTVLVLTHELRARRIGWASSASLAKVFALAYNINHAGNPPKKRKPRAHYEVWSPLVSEMPIGCTESLRDGRRESPDAKFVHVNKSKCRSCSKAYEGGMAGDQGGIR